MARGRGFLLAMLVAVPALAADVQFEGHSLDVDAGNAGKPIRSMSSPMYEIGGDAAQILARARACVAGQKGATLAAGDDADALSATLRADYRSLFAAHSIRAKLAIAASPGHFQVVMTDLGHAALAAADAADGDYAPIGQDTGGWDKGLEAAIEAEKSIVDCVYR